VTWHHYPGASPNVAHIVNAISCLCDVVGRTWHVHSQFPLIIPSFALPEFCSIVTEAICSGFTLPMSWNARLHVSVPVRLLGQIQPEHDDARNLQWRFRAAMPKTVSCRGAATSRRSRHVADLRWLQLASKAECDIACIPGRAAITVTPLTSAPAVSRPSAATSGGSRGRDWTASTSGVMRET